ncbi:DUF6138 family protein [Paenibacillus sp. XY044]|uniref:DUF6138 family protein n=1 Tax=Paenibacillus sp. XY044 TaxID=2026089 RepID=UPI000B97ED42|nr:DUF6138 family protein [Paenibacillus sp. XY044]OZB98287.1 hypothetical protein CJP46_03750 [Paenibacillus sp. XY044]
MNASVQLFLDEVWSLISGIYEKESKRIQEIKEVSRLQAGIKDYLGVTWSSSNPGDGYGVISIDLDRPFDWGDFSYRMNAGIYICDITDGLIIGEWLPALRTRLAEAMSAGTYGPRFFDYRFEIVLEMEREEGLRTFREVMIDEDKLAKQKRELEGFIQFKILPDLPVRPKELDEFFFARHLLNSDLFEQRGEQIEPLIGRLDEKHRSNPDRLLGWVSQYTSAFREWAEERFLARYFERTGSFGQDWTRKDSVDAADAAVMDAEDLDFFVYAALKVGHLKPELRERYLELAVRLGSEKAAGYIKNGSGRFRHRFEGTAMKGAANDVTETLEIRLHAEEEVAYREALKYITGLLSEGFPKGYKLNLRSPGKDKRYLPLNKLAKSQMHRFFAGALRYPGLHPLIAEYAKAAMEEFAWYKDVDPGEKSVMPGTYAVLGLGLLSTDYFPLLHRYMEMVDTEHQSAQDGYADAFIEAHGLAPDRIPLLVTILLGGSDLAKPVKAFVIDTPDLADALLIELESKEGYQRETVLYRIFGTRTKLAHLAGKEPSPLKEKLERMLAWYP